MNIILIKAFNKKPWRSPETYQIIESALKNKYKSVAVIIAENKMQLKSELSIYSGKSDVFIFNIAEYIEESDNSFIPDTLEELSLPHLGSSCETIRTGLNKAKAKKIFREFNILTPDFFLVEENTPDILLPARKIGYPLFVKPNFGGGHIGVESDSIVHNDEQLIKILKKGLQLYNEPMLVEKYVTEDNMREFSVGIIGNENKILLPIEIDYQNMQVETRILSGTAAQNDLEKVKLLKGDEKLKQNICNMAIQAYNAINCKDYCRVDIRLNNTGLYLLEINIMPGLGPVSFLPFAAKEIVNLDYPSLIELLVKESMNRYKLNPGLRQANL